MENAVIIKTDGSIRLIQLDGWQEALLSAALEAEAVERVWSHSLIAFGASCQVAVMGYTDKNALAKGMSVNPLAGKLLGTIVYGNLLLTYWDSHLMASDALEPQEVEKITENLRKLDR